MRRLATALLPLAVACAGAETASDTTAAAVDSTAAGAAAGADAAQPPASPRDTARGTVAGVDVMVDYGRPSKRGRTIFAADGLVPYGRVWRTGANEATTLVTSGPLTIGGTQVPAGTYTLYTVPDASAWQLVINRQTGQWGTEYDQGQDLARVPMQVTTLAAPVEQFEIAVENGALVLRWDTTQASVALGTP
jgi:hypothetical protein